MTTREGASPSKQEDAAKSDLLTEAEKKEVVRRRLAAQEAEKHRLAEQQRREEEEAAREAKLRRDMAQNSISYFTPLWEKAKAKVERLQQEQASPRIIQAAQDEMREYERGIEQANRELEE